MPAPSTTAQRVQSLLLRVEALAGLQATVGLPPAAGVTDRQWRLLQRQLDAKAREFDGRVKDLAQEHLAEPANLEGSRRVNASLGQVEMELADAYNFFDLYMDALTQRHAPRLGGLLAGCDAVAADAMRADHAALDTIEGPLVFCDRGAGAGILRERVAIDGGGENPMPLIQIPYQRLNQKLLLTSILHEAGHQALEQLRLVEVLRDLAGAAARAAGAREDVCELYARWSSEIGPDLWGFCLCGTAQIAAMQDLMGVTPERVLTIVADKPHPPPYVRLLIGYAWCRLLWGDGPWRQWEATWRDLYPLDPLPVQQRAVLEDAARVAPAIAEAFLRSGLGRLAGRPLPALFDLAAVHPEGIAGRAEAAARSGVVNLRGLRPAAHVAVFRALRDRAGLHERELDALMTQWLLRLRQPQDARSQRAS